MNTILVPIDFSDATDAVVEAASALAQAFRAKIVLAHVIQPTMAVNEFRSLGLALEHEAMGQLSHWQRELKSDGFAVETRKLCGNPAACIREEADRLAANYIVIGSHGHGALYDLVVGSTASNLLKKATCPVLVVPSTGIKSPLVHSRGESRDEAANSPSFNRERPTA